MGALYVLETPNCKTIASYFFKTTLEGNKCLLGYNHSLFPSLYVLDFF